MRYPITLVAALLATPMLMPVTEADASTGWRCYEDDQCDDVLLNDVETHIAATWPTFVTIDMNPIPYYCTKPPPKGGTKPPFTGGSSPNAAGGASTNTTGDNFAEGSIIWRTQWTGALRWFVMSGHVAAADVQLAVGPVSSSIDGALWTGNTIDYLFREGGSEVLDAGGQPTGITDLGDLAFPPSAAGQAFNSTMRVHLWLWDGDWTCSFGSGGQQVTARGHNGVAVDYPFAWTGAEYSLAQVIRTQFQAAARYAASVVH